MAREHWRDEAERRGHDRREERVRDVSRGRDDFGQADYSNLYGYDPRNRTGYRAYDDGRPMGYREPRRFDGAAAFHTDDRDYAAYPRKERDASASYERERDARRSRRNGPSDRVLWAVIMERLEDERRLDLRDVRVEVQDGEVFLDGMVRHKSDKRRIEDVADIEGVRNVQNNLRVRDRGRWTFL